MDAVVAFVRAFPSAVSLVAERRGVAIFACDEIKRYVTLPTESVQAATLFAVTE
jgi:hypothetical protein